MADQSNAEDKKLAESATMSKFFRALAIVNGNAVHRVMRGKGANAKISKAEVEVGRLVNEANQAGNHQCPKDQIWDEARRRCVPL